MNLLLKYFIHNMITFALYVAFLAAALTFSVGFYLVLNRVIKLI